MATEIKQLVINNEKLIREWNFTKNGQLNPATLSITSTKKVWWICSRGHEWEAIIRNRTHSKGCPYCNNRKVLAGFNDLQTINPALCDDWNYEMNGSQPSEYLPHSNKRVWWKCHKCGFEWESQINNRSKGDMCPNCRSSKMSNTLRASRAKKNNLAINHPELGAEWDYTRNQLTPNDYACGSDFTAWWICSWCGCSWSSQIKKRALRGDGCPNCNKRQTSFPEQTIYYYLKKIYPDACNRIKVHGIEIDVYIPQINTGVEYDGRRWHKEKLKQDNEKDQKCLSRGISLIRIRDNTLHNTSNAFIIPCIDGNEKNLENVINDLLSHLGVQYSGKININRDRVEIINQYFIGLAENSIKTKFPEIAEEWDYEKNGTLSPERVPYGFGKKVWWRCGKCGNSFLMSPNDRTSGDGSGCPDCAIKEVSRKNYISVKNLDTGIVYGSLTEAAKSCNGTKAGICACCSGDQKTAFGFHWEYVDGKKRTRHYTGKILCIETGTVFKDLSSAASWCKGDSRNINSVCRGRSKTYKGFHWEYYND